MRNRISSLPGANLFRSLLVLIIILICIISFFSFTDHLNEKAESLAKERVLIEIKQSLAMTLYDYAVHGWLEKLQNLNKTNPFILLSNYRSVPENYRGEVTVVEDRGKDGWYFEKSSGEVVYISKNKVKQVYVLNYVKLTSNEAGHLQINQIDPRVR